MFRSFRSKKKLPKDTTETSKENQVALPELKSDRRFLKEVPYMLPKDLEETNRLDFQHYALRNSLKGIHLAPIDQPSLVLDVGCGTGQWCYEMCAEFPQAMIIGLDLEFARETKPPNYKFVAGNILEGLPFADGNFDYVHQRLLVTALPTTAWPLVIKDLLRITRPGGWVELLEGGNEIAPHGPATQRIFDLTSQLVALRGLDTNGMVARTLGDYLRQAGAQNVIKKYIDVPLGEWGKHVGTLMAADFHKTFSVLREPLMNRFHIPGEEYDQLLATMLQEFEQYHTTYRFHYAYGKRV